MVLESGTSARHFIVVLNVKRSRRFFTSGFYIRRFGISMEWLKNNAGKTALFEAWLKENPAHL